MIKLIRTNSENPDFIGLVRFLDADLAVRDGEDHLFYSQFNSIANIKYVLLAYKDGNARGPASGSPARASGPGREHRTALNSPPGCRRRGRIQKALPH